MGQLTPRIRPKLARIGSEVSVQSHHSFQARVASPPDKRHNDSIPWSCFTDENTIVPVTEKSLPQDVDLEWQHLSAVVADRATKEGRPISQD